MSSPRFNQDPLIHSFYDYSRIPIWIFTEDGILTECYIRRSRPDMFTPLRDVLPRIYRDSKKQDYEVLARNNELYISIRCMPDGYDSPVFAILGPILFTSCYSLFEMRQLSFSVGLSDQNLTDLVSYLHVLEYSRAGSTLRLVTTLLHADFPSSRSTDVRSVLDQIIKAQADSANGDTRDHDRPAHTSYREELAVLQCVRDGDLDRLADTFRSQPEIRYGRMSSSPFHQTLYGVIANITLVTRFAIMGGMPEEDAFNLSDYYIQKTERVRTPAELQEINVEMGVDFTSRVAQIREQEISRYCQPVRQCMEYILRHVREKISLNVLAEEVNLSPKYLSDLFRRETGQTVLSYIQEQKIREAKFLLRHTEDSLGEISHRLNFSSQSYFTAVFRKTTNLTPRQYRALHISDERL